MIDRTLKMDFHTSELSYEHGVTSFRLSVCVLTNREGEPDWCEVGSATGHFYDLDRLTISLFELMDEESQAYSHIYSALFSDEEGITTNSDRKIYITNIIDRVDVLPEYRNQGLARLMFKKIFERCEELGGAVSALMPEKHNLEELLTIYRKLGYKETTVTDYDGDPFKVCYQFIDWQ